VGGAAPLRIERLSRAGFGPFDLALAPGECCVVSGPSGAGKTVFLRMIADLDPNEGQVWLGAEARELMAATHWRRLVTYVPAESGWWADTVREHFNETGLQAGALATELTRFQLPEALYEAPVARLSTGERQRLALLRAIVQQPRVLLLDEPTSALDPATTQCVEASLKELLRAGVIMIIVSHQPEQAQRMATCRLHISGGRASEASS
jgi:putative ABC transport system ATP-binding protein